MDKIIVTREAEIEALRGSKDPKCRALAEMLASPKRVKCWKCTARLVRDDVGCPACGANPDGPQLAHAAPSEYPWVASAGSGPG